MKIVGVLVSICTVHLCITSVVNGQRFTDHPLSTHVATVGYRDRRNKAEPTCDELRAMWRYSKRQNRAAEITNNLPMYRDPFAYNVWETYPIRSPTSFAFRDEREEQARNRGGGRTPVYGKMVHKAPPESRFRNGMPNRMKAFEEVAKYYGTVNRHPPDSPRPQYSFRAGGGSAHVPQAGSFQHLKELIRTERARELQEQRIAEEIAARASAMNEITRQGRRSIAPEIQLNYLNSLQSFEEPKSLNYDLTSSDYIPRLSNFNEDFLRGEDYERDSVLH